VDGRSHVLFNAGLFLGGLGLYSLVSGEEPVKLIEDTSFLSFTVSYFVGTVLLTPDLDLADRGVGPVRKWGPLGVLWIPYGLLHSHRGISHSYLLGPLIRLLYFLGLVVGVGLLVGVDWKKAWEAFAPHALPALLGYYLSQWGHLIADRIPFRP
jgi:uncharacterized metal-binding protein